MMNVVLVQVCCLLLLLLTATNCCMFGWLALIWLRAPGLGGLHFQEQGQCLSTAPRIELPGVARASQISQLLL